MHHEEERYNERREREQRHRPPHEEEIQNFRSRWHEPRPFMHDQERHYQDEERRWRAQHEGRQHQSRPEYRDDVNRRQHGFSGDHRGPDRRDERREWRDENEGSSFRPDNQHTQDRWQQPDQLPPLREQRRRHQSRRDEDWDERGW